MQSITAFDDNKSEKLKNMLHRKKKKSTRKGESDIRKQYKIEI
jgi:hypothetical protein